VVLLSDGADNSGGIDRDTIGRSGKRQIPVHTVGFGKEKVARTSRSATSLCRRARWPREASREGDLPEFWIRGQKVKLSVRDGAKVLATQDVF